MNSGLYRSGTVDGRMVKDILLDTGITRTLVYQKLILREKTSGEVIIHCAHGDEVSYSLAQVEIEWVVRCLEWKQVCRERCLYRCCWERMSPSW